MLSGPEQKGARVVARQVASRKESSGEKTTNATVRVVKPTARNVTGLQGNY
jgi:hypothetical protein